MRCRALLVLLPALTLACAAGEQSSSGSFDLSITNVSVAHDDTAGDDDTDASTSTPTSSTTSESPTSTGGMTGSGETVTSEPNTTGTTGPATTATTEPATSAPNTTGEPCLCDAPPDDCHTAPGECIAGECVYPPAGADVACDDGDACTADDLCDGAGACQGGAVMACDAPNTTGGACQAGVCQGFQCVAPYDDCDGDMANGCEVPVGIANQCDVGGLTTSGGCWTAYCGTSNAAGVTNFGTYYCSDCANCNTPSPGMWQWCNHKTGNYFSPASGSCGANEDIVCTP